MKLPIEHERLNRTLQDAGQKLNDLFDQVRKYLLTGVIVLVPFVVTLYILYAIFQVTDGLLGVAVSRSLGYRIPGMGIFLTGLICAIVGLIAQNYFGRRMIARVDTYLEQIPVVRSIYNGIKQVADVFVRNNRGEFKRVVLVEYPKEDSWALGFVTGDFQPAPGVTGLEKDLVTVFVPTTPNPTSGFLLIISKSRIIDAYLDIEDAMKIVISGGLVQAGKNADNGDGETVEDFVIPH